MATQFNLNNFNEFINSATDAIMCDSNCQQQRKEQELKQDFLNAKSILASASNKEEVAEKNYIIFTKGESAYNDFLENKLHKKAEIITDKYKENFDKESSKIKSQILSYLSLILNFKNVFDLFKQYKKENMILFEELKDETNDVLTNERKTYYEDQNISRLDFIYYYIFISIYVIFVLCFGAFSLIYPTSISWKIKLLLFIIFIFLPFISSWILAIIIIFAYKIYNFIPKNVYLSNFYSSSS